jgi:hypothetical protein
LILNKKGRLKAKGRSDPMRNLECGLRNDHNAKFGILV